MATSLNWDSPARLAPAAAIGRRLRPYWFVMLAGLALAIPSLLQLGRIVWSTEQGAHGPIILATGLWLLWRERMAVPTGRPGRAAIALPAVIAALVGYVVGAMAGMIWLEWLGVYLALVAVFYRYEGGAMVRRLWFPFFYLLFLVPPPFSIIYPLTRALKLLIASGSVQVMSAFGYNVAASGTTLFIDQYELLVAAACSGMNSIVSLLAIGLFYIYLRHRADWRYAALLALLVLPLAVLANFVRVILLLLITHYFGDAVGQGLLHEAAGMAMFFIALFGLMAVDGLLSPLRRRLGRRGMTT